MTTFCIAFFDSYLSTVSAVGAIFYCRCPALQRCWWIHFDVYFFFIVYARAPKVTGCQCNFWLSVPSSAWWIAFVSMSSLVYAWAPKVTGWKMVKWLSRRLVSGHLHPDLLFEIWKIICESKIPGRIIFLCKFYFLSTIFFFFSHFISVCIQTQLQLSFRLGRVDNLST